jgi:phage terminase small subunit
MSTDDTLTGKQRKAIAAILTWPTKEAAAKAAGISERQLFRWLDEPEFRAELKRAENELIQAAGTRLTAGLTLALDTLAELVKGAQSESVKRAAANDWMNHQFKNQELRTLAERIDELERTVNNGK